MFTIEVPPDVTSKDIYDALHDEAEVFQLLDTRMDHCGERDEQWAVDPWHKPQMAHHIDVFDLADALDEDEIEFDHSILPVRE